MALTAWSEHSHQCQWLGVEEFAWHLQYSAADCVRILHFWSGEVTNQSKSTLALTYSLKFTTYVIISFQINTGWQNQLLASDCNFATNRAEQHTGIADQLQLISKQGIVSTPLMTLVSISVSAIRDSNFDDDTSVISVLKFTALRSNRTLPETDTHIISISHKDFGPHIWIRVQIEEWRSEVVLQMARSGQGPLSFWRTIGTERLKNWTTFVL